MAMSNIPRVLEKSRRAPLRSYEAVLDHSFLDRFVCSFGCILLGVFGGILRVYSGCLLSILLGVFGGSIRYSLGIRGIARY